MGTHSSSSSCIMSLLSRLMDGPGMAESAVADRPPAALLLAFSFALARYTPSSASLSSSVPCSASLSLLVDASSLSESLPSSLSLPLSMDEEWVAKGDETRGDEADLEVDGRLVCNRAVIVMLMVSMLLLLCCYKP